MKVGKFERPEGLEEHHRRKGDRKKKDLRGCDVLYLTTEDHKWAEEHPEEARQLGWSVSRSEDPADIPIVIPGRLHKESPLRGRKREKKRNRRSVQLVVPADVREDGAGLFDDLIGQCKERLEAQGLATGGISSDYNALMKVMYEWLT